ncbi:MAG TPA: sulfatase [Planctomycetota bacterium]|nr:sulfatase [Planctomycetota bacterium]
MKRAALGLALALLGACGGESGSAAAPGGGGAKDATAPPAFGAFPHASLVIISLDTLRADGTSVGGGPADISPSIAAFAQEAVVFDQARTQAPHTAPSHMSLFTSTLPSVHGVQNVSFAQDANGDKGPAIIVPAREDVPTLAEVLHAAGFRTVGLTDGGNLNPPHGFARGFDTYTYDLEGAADKVALGRKEIVALTAPDSGRFFLFWHTYQIHAPYCPPGEYVDRWAPADYQGVMRERLDSLAGLSFKERFSRMKTLFWKDRDTFGPPEASFLHGVYQAGIRYTDDQLAGLFQAMRDAGVFESSIVVLLGDHGEEFFEHGHWQHEQLFEECLRVPLMIRLPGGLDGGKHITTPVALIDVMPTVLDLLGIDASGLQLPGRVRHGGRSLAETLLTGHEPKAVPILSELIDDRAKGGDFERQVAIHANGMTFVQDRVRGKRGPDGKVIYAQCLYDLKNDPGEDTNVAPNGGPVLQEFQKLYAGYEAMVQMEQAGSAEQAPVEMTPEMRKQLEALGYIDAGAAPEPEPASPPAPTTPANKP